jgi:hypothetical protein
MPSQPFNPDQEFAEFFTDVDLLRAWWQTGVNDISTPRPDTISPIPEGIPCWKPNELRVAANPATARRKRAWWSKLNAR